MNYQDRWLLPAGITELLPPEAMHLENLRRRLIDLYTTWGYELVIPPMIEYLESLLIGTGHDLDLQTFKLTDQLTGRLMGMRADMTPQVTRIDAHRLKRDVPTRLCYLGTVLHTRPNGFAGSRSPFQVGAELYGHAGIASDAEILSLMLTTLRETGIETFHVDVGHVAIYRDLVEQAQLNPVQQEQLFDAVQRKDSAEVRSLLANWQVAQDLRNMLNILVELHGDSNILVQARQALVNATPTIQEALQELEQLITYLPEITLHFDLAELRGYNYHTGVVFAAYIVGQGQAIAQGGRYDNIGKVFGRARPATGFSTDLRVLTALAPPLLSPSSAIFAPAINDIALRTKIAELRQQGQKVICELPNQSGNARAMGCDRQLQRVGQRWQVVSSDETSTI